MIDFLKKNCFCSKIHLKSLLEQSYRLPMILRKRKNLIKRLDRLFHLKISGTPQELADRLEISRATFFRVLDEMKEFGAPITYDEFRKCYYYKYPGTFHIGFKPSEEELSFDDKQKIRGGMFIPNITYLTLLST